MNSLMFSLGICLSASMGSIQQPSGVKEAPSRVHHELRVLIVEQIDAESEHEEYAQFAPVQVPIDVRGTGGTISGRVSFMSGCKWRLPEGSLPTTLKYPLLPQEDEDPPRPRLRRDPPLENPPLLPPPPGLPPLRTDSLTPVVSLRLSSLNMSIRAGRGSGFDLDAFSPQGTPIGGSSGGGGSAVVPPPPGAPPPPPPPGTKLAAGAEKSSLLGDGDGSDADDQDVPLLAGPELALPLKLDLSEWRAFCWLPSGSQLILYGHALFGELRVFDGVLDVSLYGVGPRLGIPLIRSTAFHIDALVSVGPALLRTDIGEAAGVDATIGFGCRLALTGFASLACSAEYRGFAADDVRAHGPSFSFGLDLAW